MSELRIPTLISDEAWWMAGGTLENQDTEMGTFAPGAGNGHNNQPRIVASRPYTVAQINQKISSATRSEETTRNYRNRSLIVTIAAVAIFVLLIVLTHGAIIPALAAVKIGTIVSGVVFVGAGAITFGFYIDSKQDERKRKIWDCYLRNQENNPTAKMIAAELRISECEVYSIIKKPR